MKKFEIILKNEKTGEKIHTFTWAANHVVAKIRIRETMDRQGSWSGWTF